MEIPRISAQDYITRRPEWALRQRLLIRLMNDAADVLLEKYVHPDGSIMWPPNDDYSDINGLDDAYESFHNWPLFYLAGGAQKLLDYSRRGFDEVTRQFARYDCGHGHPMVVKEYEQGYDWMHQGEGYLFFYHLNLADPANEKNHTRSVRYAGFYLNEDPEAQNYDPERRLVKCCHNGSMGPAYRNFTGAPWTHAPWKDFYGLPFHDVPGCRTVEDIKVLDNALNMGRAMQERMAYGDTAVNLAITSMVTNAYLHTGEDKYLTWVRDYVEAWIERTERNGGIIPDNVGPNGVIGERMGGKWYGGYYGWTWPHGFDTIASALLAACENAALLFRDPSYVDWARCQIDLLLERGIERDGTLHVPHKYADLDAIHEYVQRPDVVLTTEGRITDRHDFFRLLQKDGWFEYRPMNPRFLTHVWMVSQDPADIERLRKIRNVATRGWECIRHFYEKDQGGHESAWLAWLGGEFSRYPERILEHNTFQTYERLKLMRTDTEDPRTYSDSYLQMRNPVTMEGLVQLTMGGPLPVYNGGLLMVSVRYFDTNARRPGLPEDVAALVHNIDASGIRLILVNLSPLAARSLVIQGGAFGEHRFTYASTGVVKGVVKEDASPIPVSASGIERSRDKVKVDGSHLRVDLEPSSTIELHLGMERFAMRPSYHLSWS